MFSLVRLSLKESLGRCLGQGLTGPVTTMAAVCNLKRGNSTPSLSCDHAMLEALRRVNHYGDSKPLYGHLWRRFWRCCLLEKKAANRCGCASLGAKRKHVKTKTHKHKNFTGLSQDFWGGILFYVFFSPIRNDPKKHINKILPPTQSRDNPANLFMFMCVFSFPEWNINTTAVATHYGLKRHNVFDTDGSFGPLEHVRR